MLAEIITIGDEILIGQVIDTNSAFIAAQLEKVGIALKQISSVSDQKQHIINALDEASSRVDIIIMTGGLGPTKDDITKDVLCDYFDCALIVNEAAYKNVERLFAALNLPMININEKQAEVPEACTVLQNPNGTAPGMWFEREGKIYVSLPGVPYEMKYLLENEVIPRLRKLFSLPAIVHRTVLTVGIGESFLADKIEKWADALTDKGIKLAYLPAPGRVRLRMSVYGKEKKLADDLLDAEVEALSKIIPENIYGFDEASLEKIIGELLTKKGQTIATAESCTGGNLAKMITSIPGSSTYFKGAIIAYSNEVKMNFLAVSEENLSKYGAVSQEVVEQMAIGVRDKLGTDYALATSGIAGPDGGSEEKPVGTIWIAAASKEKVISKKLSLGKNRERNVIRTSIALLDLLRREFLR